MEPGMSPIWPSAAGVAPFLVTYSSFSITSPDLGSCMHNSTWHGPSSHSVCWQARRKGEATESADRQIATKLWTTFDAC